MAELHSQARLARQSSARATPPSAPLFASAASAAAATATAEADLAKATARIDELEQLLEDAEIENQHLTEQLEEVLTAGRAGPGSVGSVAEEAASPLPYGAGPGHVAAGHTGASSNPYSYGHAATLTLSALEQRLAMAEARRDELAAALEEAAAANRRLEEQLAAGRQQPAALRRGDSADRQVSTLGRSCKAVRLVVSVYRLTLSFCRTRACVAIRKSLMITQSVRKQECQASTEQSTKLTAQASCQLSSCPTSLACGFGLLPPHRPACGRRR